MAHASTEHSPTLVYDLEEDFFHRFKLQKERVLGKGMAGEVFLATSKAGSGRKLAVKVFSLAEDVRERSMRQFTTEAGGMQAVSHPHVVPCVVAARCPDYAALAMPYYSRGCLADLPVHLPSRLAHRYISHVTRGLEHLHRQHISHNDLKLDNVFVDAGKRAHLGDLGLAVEVSDACPTVQAGLVGGTRAYWSPEKLEADTRDRIDPRKADVYALGVMYWALVSGEDPEKDTDYLDKVRTSHLDISTPQRSLLERLLEPKPEDRPTASQVYQTGLPDSGHVGVYEDTLWGDLMIMNYSNRVL